MICPHIPAESRAEYECSDRILVASNLFHDLKMGIWQSRLIHIQNSNNESIAGYIFNIHPEPNILYIPSWMYRMLNAYEAKTLVELKTVECDRIVFEPNTREFTNTLNWKEQLAIQISKYTTLMPKSQVYIQLNGNMYPIRIDNLFPKSDCIAYKIKKNVLCDIVISAPTINVEDTPDIPFLVFPKKKKPSFLSFIGNGIVLGGPSPPKNKTPAQMSYMAVLQRLGRRR
jgi:hypothetical protein